MKQIYLDYAAATPVDDRVLATMKPYFADNFYNPSAIYLAARSMRRELDEIRHRVAVVLGAKPAEIIFTAGATEANNLAIQGVMKQFPHAEIVVSSIEHESVLAPAGLFGAKQAPVDNDGLIILNKLSNLITADTVLVSVMLVNNELGTIQPLKEIASLLDGERSKRLKTGNKLPIHLHTDAAQAPNYLDVHAARLGVDMMSLNGGKIYGPKQSGVLYIKAGIRLAPLLVGGGQEFGLRSGTENIAAAAGFATALEIAQAQHKAEAARLTKLRLTFERRLQAATPQAIVNGARKRAPHLINVTFPGKDNERLMMELDEAGIMCAVGSACSAARDEASHVLSAIGLSESAARATLRFSLGRHTSQPDILKTVKQLSALTGSNR
jgi:cysteine desulfurase